MRPASGISGVVTDSHGNRLAGVCVDIFDDNGDFAVTRHDGSFSAKGIEPGRHGVEFTGGCGSKGSIAPQYYDHASSFLTAAPVDFVGGKFSRSINATMQPGGTLVGKVTDTAGHPLKNICAGASPQGEFEGIDSDNEGFSNAEGHYRVTNLAPGAYEATVGCGFGKFATRWLPSAPNSAQASLISVPAGVVTTANTTALQHSGVITGTVTTKAGKPATQVCVELADARTRQFVATNFEGGFTNKSGHYRLGDLTPGRYLVQFVDCREEPQLAEQWFGHSAAVSVAKPVIVKPGATTSGINAALTPGGIVSGQVRTSAGAPAPGTCVEALTFADETAAETVANKAGDYALTGLATGRYAVAFGPCDPRKGADGRVTLPSVGVKAGRTLKGLNAKLTVGGAISGVVSIAGQSASLTGTCVLAVPATSSGNLNAEFDAEEVQGTGKGGHFTISGLAPGTYQVIFNDSFCNFDDIPPAFAPQWFQGKLTQGTADKVTVTAGKTTTGIDASLQGFGGLAGVVQTASHAAVPGECVTAVPQDTTVDPFSGLPATPEVAITNSAGRYSMVSLPPGAYKIKFSGGCGATGLTTQWWDGVGSAAKATVVNVTPATTTTGIDATVSK